MLRWITAIAMLSIRLLAGSPLFAVEPIPGAEFVVNAYTTGNQLAPSIAMDSDGDFVMVWGSDGQDGSGLGVFGQRFSQAGIPLAAEFLVNTYTLSRQQRPAVAISASGAFVVVWDRYIAVSNYEVLARRFNASGSPQGGEVQVNTYTTGAQLRPAVGMGDAGAFVVAWQSYDQDGSDTGVFAQRFDDAGAPQGGEFRVNTYTPGYQKLAAVALKANGGFVVAWSSDQDGGGTGVFAKRFTSAGYVLAGEFQVNLHTPDSQKYPDVAIDDVGDFVVTWDSLDQDGSNYGIFARRFDSLGAPLATELQVNTYTTFGQASSSVTMGPGGDFLVVWKSSQEASSSPNSEGVFGQRYDSAGVRLASEFHVNTYTLDYQGVPDVAQDDDGDFVVAWRAAAAGGPDVIARRFVTPAVLDIDGNGATAPLTDGLLVLRFLFGFTGPTLTTGAVDLAGCTRCDASSIQAYLGTLI